MKIEAQEALGDSFVSTSAPKGPQDRERDEKLGSLAAPRGSQRNLKIVIFGLKPEQKGRKEASRMHLSKVMNFDGIL